MVNNKSLTGAIDTWRCLEYLEQIPVERQVKHSPMGRYLAGDTIKSYFKELALHIESHSDIVTDDYTRRRANTLVEIACERAEKYGIFKNPPWFLSHKEFVPYLALFLLDKNSEGYAAENSILLLGGIIDLYESKLDYELRKKFLSSHSSNTRFDTERRQKIWVGLVRDSLSKRERKEGYFAKEIICAAKNLFSDGSERGNENTEAWVRSNLGVMEHGVYYIEPKKREGDVRYDFTSDVIRRFFEASSAASALYRDVYIGIGGSGLHFLQEDRKVLDMLKSAAPEDRKALGMLNFVCRDPMSKEMALDWPAPWQHHILKFRKFLETAVEESFQDSCK